jgi:voltage-gated potassium channel
MSIALFQSSIHHEFCGKFAFVNLLKNSIVFFLKKIKGTLSTSTHFRFDRKIWICRYDNGISELMKSTKNLLISLALSLLFLVAGSVGYMLIEGWSLTDALYMTVITISTVGYSEVHSMSRPGRIFTIFLVFFGVAFFLYVAGSLVQFMVEGRMRDILGRRTLNKKIETIKNHYIICGYGRIGQVLYNHLQAYQQVNAVVIEKNPELISRLEADNVLYLSGDASDEEMLLKAGIKRAKALIAVLATDTDNVFLVLTARQLNPHIHIMARASSQKAKSKLKAAGANHVESPYDTGAVSMAQRILRPSVSSFLDFVFDYRLKDIQMEEFPVAPGSPLANVMLKDSGLRQKYNLIIIAIKRGDGNMVFNPSFETIMNVGDTLIAMGKNENLLALEKTIKPFDAENATQ